MSTAAMIVIHVLAKNSPEVPFIDNDHMVQAFPSDRADHTFDIRALPRRTWRYQDLLDIQ